jgi:transposase
VTIVMGLDQHRAQITADWLDTSSGEISRARIVPADRAGVRRFAGRFRGRPLEVALEATTGWRFVVAALQAVGAQVHLAVAGGDRGPAGDEEARQERSRRRAAPARAADGRPAARVVDPA